MKNIEKELKYQISKEDFKKFKKFLDNNRYKKITSFTQINYYIDTEELFFKEKNITARIRKIIDTTDKYEFTLKIPLKNTNRPNIKIQNEFSIDLEKDIAQDLINKGDFKYYSYVFKPIIEEIKDDICLEKIKIIGSLMTMRELYLIDRKYDPINIDLSSYMDVEDYEIEWETDKINEVEKIIMNVFKELNIIPMDKAISKKSRFFNIYLQEKNRNKITNIYDKSLL